LLGIDAEDALPCFDFIGSRFQDLAEWLEHDLAGRHGRLIVPGDPWPKHVGYAVEQTVFRLRDRQVLSTFFANRLQGSLDGFDPLRRLQRWSGRAALTQHALKLIEGEEFADRVRAAIRTAFRSWDGAELVETGSVGRFWPARLHFLIYPQPHLQVGARNPKPLELAINGEQHTLEPERELELPWALLERLRARPVDLGDPHSLAGGLRLPQLGDTKAVITVCGASLITGRMRAGPCRCHPPPPPGPTSRRPPTRSSLMASHANSKPMPARVGAATQPFRGIRGVAKSSLDHDMYSMGRLLSPKQ
jgi:hypothetical protein